MLLTCYRLSFSSDHGVTKPPPESRSASVKYGLHTLVRMSAHADVSKEDSGGHYVIGQDERFLGRFVEVICSGAFVN
jgi:hypothetical protein